MAVAICINSAWSDGALILGESYEVETLRPIWGFENLTKVFAIPEDQFVHENFLLDENGDTFVFKNKASLKPVYVGTISRFEVIFSRSQLDAAIQRVKDRRQFV